MEIPPYAAYARLAKAESTRVNARGESTKTDDAEQSDRGDCRRRSQTQKGSSRQSRVSARTRASAAENSANGGSEAVESRAVDLL
jgi:hypothetical protein